jgi:two-component system NarL family response regulator
MNRHEPSAPTINVLAVDDHPVLLDGIVLALSDEPDMALVAQATDGSSAIAQFRLHRPDVTLMDLQMPDMSGIDVLRVIRHEFPVARVIMLATHPGDSQVTTALKAGAAGFLLKGMLRKDLRNTIRAVYSGRRVIPPEVVLAVAEHVTDGPLSAQEIDVLKGVARGRGDKEIGADLQIAEDAVKLHLNNILVKLQTQDRGDAVLLALKIGILEV